MQKDTKKIKKHKFSYPVEIALDFIGGKWKLLILWLLKDEVYRFSELKRLVPQITQKMLTNQLRELESDGLVHRKVYAQVPPKVEYSLTDLGKSFLPILRSMHKWGESFANNN
ncbi:MAG: helix-turn-helix transcriptional regulator [Calditrichia bacterium]|jgi:DNA-binding HxlR family transcriptional regulator|nr:helix-turn-helix transcriptional regulator [Calditrichia bacterium]